MDPEQVAARWFVLRFDQVPLTRWQLTRIGFVDFVTGLVPFGFSFYEANPRALIEVVRRDDDTVLASFTEAGERRTSERMLELRTALLGLDPAAFCDRYDIPRDAVTGPGEDVVEDELVR
ncbi:hypothetical protein GUY44_07965 [Pimelobacter simplex]|uniref:hypothetical protein n=1 Tax=Nocardioides simplex TaxID=2045 RepID=UPI0008EEBBC2|nr:hypothetical protein [Pimelobacter simplex]MCG8150410.1 hypothetical protein [Pimelobacter simplex]GEB16773.1 hypothetical protein NSI01_50880 [Pimelobacter simplex]SFM88698.1 hypothetical protein SAMN05421671_4010 [Pimelobacter simplex]